MEALSSYVRCEEMLKVRKPGPIVDMTCQAPIHMIEKSAKSFKYFPLWCGLRNTSLSEVRAPLHSWINFLIVHDSAGGSRTLNLDAFTVNLKRQLHMCKKKKCNSFEKKMSFCFLRL